jgi:two-component system nitrate/nitrite response regulator NarL
MDVQPQPVEGLRHGWGDDSIRAGAPARIGTNGAAEAGEPAHDRDLRGLADHAHDGGPGAPDGRSQGGLHGGPNDKPKSQPIRVLVVAETRLYREGLAFILARRRHLTVVATASSPEEALAAAREHEVDVALVDVSGSTSSLKAIVTEVPAHKVVVVALPEDDRAVLACAKLGVSGYVPREDSLQDLVLTIDSVANGQPRCPPRVAAVLLKRVTEDGEPDQPDLAGRLTAREREILGLIAEGLSNKQIARRLSIGLSTVKNHVHSIMKKLDVRERHQAVTRLRAGGARVETPTGEI